MARRVAALPSSVATVRLPPARSLWLVGQPAGQRARQREHEQPGQERDEATPSASAPALGIRVQRGEHAADAGHLEELAAAAVVEPDRRQRIGDEDELAERGQGSSSGRSSAMYRHSRAMSNAATAGPEPGEQEGAGREGCRPGWSSASSRPGTCVAEGVHLAVIAPVVQEHDGRRRRPSSTARRRPGPLRGQLAGDGPRPPRARKRPGRAPWASSRA